MHWIIERLCPMPPLPPIALPLPERISRPILAVIHEGFEIVFQAGLAWGFAYGAIAATVVILGLSLRRRQNDALQVVYAYQPNEYDPRLGVGG